MRRPPHPPLTPTTASEKRVTFLYGPQPPAARPDPPTVTFETRAASGDPTLGPELIHLLGKHGDLPLDLLADVLLILEILSLDNGARQRIEPLLLEIALRMRDDRRGASRPVMWSALRRFATVASATRAAVLIEFLREADDATTRQLALHCVQAIFFQEPVETVDPRLYARVRQLVEGYVHRDIAISPEMRSLAANAVVACSALEPERANELAEKVRMLGRPGVTALVGAKWRDALESADGATAESLRAALAVLAA